MIYIRGVGGKGAEYFKYIDSAPPGFCLPPLAPRIGAQAEALVRVGMVHVAVRVQSAA